VGRGQFESAELEGGRDGAADEAERTERAGLLPVPRRDHDLGDLTELDLRPETVNGI
jgi:hypothetical protein